MSLPIVHGEGVITDPPEPIDRPGLPEICNIRISFDATDPRRPDPLVMLGAAYGDTARIASTLQAGERVLVVGKLRAVKNGAGRGYPELVVDSIAVIPEPDDPTAGRSQPQPQ